MGAAERFTPLLQCSQGGGEFPFGPLDVTRRGKDLRAACATERHQWAIAMASHETHNDVVPLCESLEVPNDFEGENEIATCFTDGLEVAPLPSRSRRHRLIQMLDPFIDLSGRHQQQPGSSETPDLKVPVAMGSRHGQRFPRA